MSDNMSMFDGYRSRLFDLLRELSYEKRRVVMSDGRTRGFDIDVKQAVLSAEGTFLVGYLLGDMLAEFAPEVRAVGGLETGAIPLVSAVSTVGATLGEPMVSFYVRKAPKGHATGKYIEGDKLLCPGMPVAIIDDVLTTGRAVTAAAKRAREIGLDVRRILVLLDREEGGREAAEKIAPVSALFRISEFGEINH
jgi:orotate phosphoribosyltransferase